MAKTLRELVEETARPRRSVRRWWLAAAFLLAFSAGAGTMQARGAYRMDVLADTVTAWKKLTDEEKQAYHPKPVVTSAGDAWRAVKKMANQRRMSDGQGVRVQAPAGASAAR